MLLATGSKILVETAPDRGYIKGDRKWRIGLTEEKALTTPENQWDQNLLRKALMHARNRIRALKDIKRASTAANSVVTSLS